MDKFKVKNLVDLIQSRMRNCQSLNSQDFDLVLHSELHELSRSELERIVDVLFNEHIRLTALINAISAFYQVLDEFGLLFDDDIVK